MRFHNNTHPYYRGIDLHDRTHYVCIIDHTSKVLIHSEISDDANKLQKILPPPI